MAGSVSIWNYATNFDTVEFFRIGTDRFPVLAKLVGYGYGGSIDNEDAHTEQAYVGAYHIDGNEWGIRPYWDDPSVQKSQLTSKYVHNLFYGCERNDPNDPLPADYTQTMAIVYESLDRH